MITCLRRQSVLAAAIMLALLLTPANIFPCGPYFQEPVFTQPDGPDQPLDLFVKGRLGILLPGYQTQYLVVAYRYLAGPKLTPAEEQAVIAAWKPKIIPRGEAWSHQIPINSWLQARSAALGLSGVAKVDIGRFRRIPGGWQEYPNCGLDAFNSAAETVANLAKAFGVGSEPVRDWVDAQDTVFKNCHGSPYLPSTESPVYIPKPPTIQNPVLRMDRDYQIAAANFYAGNWQTAAQQFQQIAENRESPWHTWAPYLVARCHIRQATLGSAGNSSAKPAGSEGSSFNVQNMTAAEQQLQKILHDPKLASIHPAAQRLLNYVEGRLHPDQRLHEVAQQLEGKAPTNDFVQDLTDFNWLLSRHSRDDQSQPAAQDDLTDWVLAFWHLTPRTHPFERWQATKSDAWLLTALMYADYKDATVPELERAAAAIAPSSPVYEMAVYHRVRLLIDLGLINKSSCNAARQLLDANLKRFESGPLSSYNMLLAKRFELASNFHQFLEFAPRTPVELAWDMGGQEELAPEGKTQPTPLPKLFNADSTRIINARLPLALLTQAANGKVLPSDLRGIIATATWTRAVIVNDPQTAKAVTATAIAAHPELRDYITAYDNADSKASRTFAATWTMLYFPGMRPFVTAGLPRETDFAAIDNYRNNWWCEDVGANENLPVNTVFYGDSRVPVDPMTGARVTLVLPDSPAFLTAAERAAAEKERDELLRTGAAPNYFGRVVLGWARQHPDDERVPEALYLVVRATRYGCTNADTGRFSKQAFDLLHKEYPKAPWTQKTPYWFK